VGLRKRESRESWGRKNLPLEGKEVSGRKGYLYSSPEGNHRGSGKKRETEDTVFNIGRGAREDSLDLTGSTRRKIQDRRSSSAREKRGGGWRKKFGGEGRKARKSSEIKEVLKERMWRYFLPGGKGW